MTLNLFYIELLTVFRLVFFYGIYGFISYLKFYLGKESIQVNLGSRDKNIYLRKQTSDIAVFCSIYAFSEFKYAFKIPQGGVILDLGANIGISTIYFAQKYPTAKIFAIEPNLDSFLLLKKKHTMLQKCGLPSCCYLE